MTADQELTHRSKLNERLENLNDQAKVVHFDIVFKQMQVVDGLRDQVDWLDVVRLVTQVILVECTQRVGGMNG